MSLGYLPTRNFYQRSLNVTKPMAVVVVSFEGHVEDPERRRHPSYATRSTRPTSPSVQQGYLALSK